MIKDFIRDLTSRFRPLPAHKRLVDTFCSKKFPITIGGIRKLPLAAVLADLFRYSKGSFLIVLPNDKEAELFFEDVSLCADDVCLIPSWNTLPYRGESPGAQAYGKRIKALTKLVAGKKCIAVTSVGAFLTPMVSADYFKKHISVLKKGQSVNTAKLEEAMQSCGYIRTPKVSVPGDFAIRGEVFDFFPFGSDEPVRAVFEFDEIDAIKTFDPITQASTGKLERVVIPPCKEILWDVERIEAVRKLGILKDAALESLETENEVAEEQYILPMTFEKQGHLVDYMGDDSSLFLVDYELLEQRAEAVLDEYKASTKSTEWEPAFRAFDASVELLKAGALCCLFCTTAPMPRMPSHIPTSRAALSSATSHTLRMSFPSSSRTTIRFTFSQAPGYRPRE